MNKMAGLSNVSHKTRSRRNEHGSATTKFLVIVVALFLVAHAGYNYIIVWYQCSHFKDAMTETITQAYAIPNAQLNSPEYIKKKLRRIGDEDGVPADAIFKIERTNNGTQAQVFFTREVSILPFNMYKYKYDFDYTAAPPTGFLTK